MTRPFPKAVSRKILLAVSNAAGGSLPGIARYAREHDWHLVTHMMFTGVLPRGWRGDGVLAVVPYRPDLLAHLEQTGMPCVSLSGADEMSRLVRVEPDHAGIGRLAADHLLERAHRSFAWAPFLNDGENRERRAGFEARLAEHGCACRALPPAHLRIGPYWQDNWADYRRALVDELRRLPRPTAVFACNDCVAIEVIDACREAGLTVPEDLAVLGAGNSFLAESAPVPLSSVDPDLEEIGYRAAAELDRIVSGDDVGPPLTRVPPKGVVARVSTNILAVQNPRVARALSYIAEHYPNPMLSVGDVAAAVGMSRRNLERSFREATGSTIKEHISSIRMREASRLLKTHARARSSDVAELVGLGGPRTFFRAFRRYFGVSPKAHRDWAAQSSDASRDFETPPPRPAGARPPRVATTGDRPTAA